MYKKEERKERQQKIMRFFNSLRNELKKYIYEQDKNSSNLNPKECRILFSVLGLDTNSCNSIYEGILNNYISESQRIHFNVNNRIISFNYTDPYWLLGWCVFGSVNSSNRMPMLRANNNITDVFWPIHGHFLNDDLVLGAKVDDNIPPELYFLVKENQYDDDRKTKFNSILKQSELIIIFGHSIHGIDLEYYLPFLRCNLQVFTQQFSEKLQLADFRNHDATYFC